MPRQLKCRMCPEWHEIDDTWPRACAGHFRRSDEKRSKLSAPYFISDDLGPNGLLNHADNKVYTSKAEYVRGVKRAGCEIVGNETVGRPKYEKPKLADDVKRDIRGWVETKFRAKKGQRYR